MSKKELFPKDWREGRGDDCAPGNCMSKAGQKDIAAALGVTEGAVSQWMKRAKKDCPDALRHHPAGSRAQTDA